MKKIFLLITFLFSFSISSYAFADETGNGTIIVKTTEKVPGANCGDKQPDGTYNCKIAPGFASIMLMIGNFIKYFTIIASIAGVLFLVINGISLSMGGLDSEASQRTKDYIVRTISGLILLLFTGVILNVIAPWIYR